MNTRDIAIYLIILSVIILLIGLTQEKKVLFVMIFVLICWIGLAILLVNLQLPLIVFPVFIYLSYVLLVYLSMFYYALSTGFTGNYNIWIKGSKRVFNTFFKVKIIGNKPRFPVIYALPNNHFSDTFELCLLPFVSEDARIVSSVRNPIIRNVIVDNLIDVNADVKGNFDNFNSSIKKCIYEEQRSVILFPEGAKARYVKKSWKTLAPLQSGTFITAYNENIPIVPVIIEKYCSIEGFFVPGTIKIHFLEPIIPDNALSPNWLKDEYEIKIRNALLSI